MPAIEPIEVEITLTPKESARLIEECAILREREMEYIRQAQTQERCIASLRRRVTELEEQVRRSVCVQHQG